MLSYEFNPSKGITVKRLAVFLLAFAVALPGWAAFDLKEDTASQEWCFVLYDESDGTIHTGETIANTEVEIYKSGSTTHTDKNSGGCTEEGTSGKYCCTFDATDSNTAGSMKVTIVNSGSLVNQYNLNVLTDNWYDSKYGTDELDTSVVQWLGTAAATPTTAGVPEVDVTYVEGELVPESGGTGSIPADAVYWEGELIPEATGTGIPQVDVQYVEATAQTSADLADFADAGYNPATNKVQGVVLVDTTTTNTDMVGEPLSAAQTEAEVTDAIGAARLDELIAADSDFDGAAPPTTGSAFYELMNDGPTHAFQKENDSLLALRTRGDAAWDTATGFALASVVGALNDAASDGDPTDSETIIQYLKQIINTLEGSAGIPAFPASAVPANNVSLAEALRQVYDETAGLDGDGMVGTDGANTTVPDAAGTAATPTEVATALTNIGLDHLVAVAVADEVVDDSIIAKLAASDGDWSGYTPANEALEAIITTGSTGPWTTGGGTGLTALASGDARAGAENDEIDLATAETFADDELIGTVVKIVAGTGAGQNRCITDNASASDMATVDAAWETNPDATSDYEIVAGVASTCPSTVAAAAGTILAADCSDASTTSDTLGAICSDWEDGGRLDTVADAVKAVTDNLPNSGALTDIDTGVNNLETRVPDTISLAAIEAEAQDAIQDTLEGVVDINDNIARCTVENTNFTPTTTAFQCLPTDLDDGAITLATGDWQGGYMRVRDGNQIREKRYIGTTTWDAGNSEIKLETGRAWPAALADGDVVLIY